MQVVHYADVKPIERHGDGFRSGVITFRDLLVGVEGSPGNFGFQLVDVPGGYATPQHRHNFEQVRIMLDGSFGFGPGRVQDKGSVGYFCEGTYYTQHGEHKSTTLLLQMGGPSQQGFMSRAQLRRGIEQLSARGRFESGVYTWLDANGKKHNQDSYEAVWEHIHERSIAYPKPQYDGPILFRPERFEYLPVTGQPGVWFKRLGRFNDHGLEIAMLKIQAGARCLLAATDQAYLLFCEQGAGVIGQTARTRAKPANWTDWTSIHCELNEALTLSALSKSEFYLLGLPRFAGSREAQ
jgi:hypothetical protein